MAQLPGDFRAACLAARARAAVPSQLLTEGEAGFLLLLAPAPSRTHLLDSAHGPPHPLEAPTGKYLGTLLS